MEENKGKEKHLYLKTIGTIALYIVGVGVLFLLTYLSMKDIAKDIKSYETYGRTETANLASLDFQTRVTGGFVLGTGTISEKDYYVAFEVAEDGGYELRKYPCSYSKLYPQLNDDEQPYVETQFSEAGTVLKCKLYVPKVLTNLQCK